jgi:hypothetical protein
MEITNANVTLDSLTLTNGYSSGGGGGIRVDGGAAITISNCTLSGNTDDPAIIPSFGGAIYNLGTLTVINSTFSGNISGNSATPGGYGGGIYNLGTLTAINSTFSGNSAPSEGFGGGIYNNNGTNTLINCTLAGNSAGYGGGIYQDASGMSVLTNTVVAANTAATDPDIFGPFSGMNNLTNGMPLLAPLGNYGGPAQTMPPLTGSPAIDAGNDSVTNFLTTDQRGYPRLVGAHVDIGAVESQLSFVVTTNADSGPGSLRLAIAAVGPGGDITFSNTLSGQTIHLTSGQLTLSKQITITAPVGGLYISGNNSSRVFEVASNATATFNSFLIEYGNASGSGGGVLVDDDATLTINNSTLYGNSASGSGGGIENDGTLTLTSSTVWYNSSSDAAGGIDNNGTLTGTDCTISYNSTTNNGGGIDNESGGTITLTNSTLSGDSANSGSGGGIYNYESTLTIDGSTLSGNSAPVGGGIQNNNAMLAIYDSTFFGDSAGSGNGGGINNYDFGTATLINCTLSGNSASQDGGGINNSGTLTLTNAIVAQNTAPSGANISGSFSGAYNLTSGDPLLAPLGNYGGPTQTMPPLFGSSAFDYGDDSVTSFLTTDQRGYPRKSGSHVDIGAVEAQLAPANNPPQLVGSSFSSSGGGGANGFQFTFTNVPDADFTVLATTNLALPLSDWIPIGNTAQNPPGQYQFTDPGATNYPQRFYQVVSP